MNLHFPDEVATNVLTIDARTRSRARPSSRRPRSAWSRSSVDLRLLAAEPSDAEREAIDAVVGGRRETNGHRVARADRTAGICSSPRSAPRSGASAG